MGQGVRHTDRDSHERDLHCRDSVQGLTDSEAGNTAAGHSFELAKEYFGGEKTWQD